MSDEPFAPSPNHPTPAAARLALHRAARDAVGAAAPLMRLACVQPTTEEACAALRLALAALNALVLLETAAEARCEAAWLELIGESREEKEVSKCMTKD